MLSTSVVFLTIINVGASLSMWSITWYMCTCIWESHPVFLLHNQKIIFLAPFLISAYWVNFASSIILRLPYCSSALKTTLNSTTVFKKCVRYVFTLKLNCYKINQIQTKKARYGIYCTLLWYFLFVQYYFWKIYVILDTFILENYYNLKLVK